MATAEPALDVFDRARELVTPGLRAAADRMNPATRLVIGYHLGWWDEHGEPLAGNPGKAVRPALALLAAEAVGGTAADATGAGVAVELAHNYSLLHDDIMDGDRTRRHRPTAWTVFGTPAAILAGDALLSLATEALVAAGPPLASAGVPRLDDALLRLVDGQAADVAFEGRADVGLPECVTMAADKTGALFAAACELGALAAGAPPERVWQLRRFGEHLGLAFQLVDDLLGIWGEPGNTGKPVLADLRARKKSLPVVAALDAGNGAAARLAELYGRPGPLSDADLRTCAGLIEEAGGRAWAGQEAERQLQAALATLQAANPERTAAAELTALAHRLGTPSAPSPAAATDEPSGVEPPSVELPEFHLGRPARCNRQLETARTHTAAWARRVNLLDPADVVPWTEAQLAGYDFGLLGAHQFPDAATEPLTTITDWYTALFHLDDYLVEAYARTGDPAGAQAFLAGLPRFLPADLDVPPPGHPVERALADVWARTAPVMSREWRRRTRAELGELLAGQLQELRHAVAGDTLDPVGYLALKRTTNGGRVAALLAEYAQGAELPSGIAGSPTMRALVDAVTDCALLLNDLYSYEREAADPAETGNMVLVLQRTLGCSPEVAIAATDDVLTARFRHFERLADVDVPALCARHRLSPPDTAAVAGLAESLRDWLPGWLAWHRRSARYRTADPAPVALPRPPTGPTGFGTATARHRSRPVSPAATPPRGPRPVTPPGSRSAEPVPPG